MTFENLELVFFRILTPVTYSLPALIKSAGHKNNTPILHEFTTYLQFTHDNTSFGHLFQCFQ